MHLKVLLGQAMKNNNNRDASYPGGPDFRPDVWPRQRPRSEENDQFIGNVEEVTDVVLEFRTDVDVGFIKKRRRAARCHFSRNLTRYPRVFARVADEHETRAVFGRHPSIVDPTRYGWMTVSVTPADWLKVPVIAECA